MLSIIITYIVVVRFLDHDFRATALGCLRAKKGGILPSEKADAERVLADTQLDEGKPTPPLPAFNYKTTPSSLTCNIADKEASFVSVTFTPDPLVIPGDAVRVNVELFCQLEAHDPRLRITSVSLRVVVPDNEVRSVEPRKLLINKGVVDVRRTDRADGNGTAELVFGPARVGTGGTKETTIERSGEEAIYRVIQGGVVQNNAVLSIKDNSARGICNDVEQLSFTLGRQPREILCICSVSAMVDGDSVPITRHVRSGARSWIRGIGMGPWLSFLQL